MRRAWPRTRRRRRAGTRRSRRTSSGRRPIPGLSHASPVVWGDRVFVVTAEGSDPNPTYVPKDRGISLARDEVKHAWRIYALDKRTGRVLWQQTAHEGVPRARRHIKATQANSTPVTDGRTIVALMGSEGLYAYDFSGKLLWKQDLGVLNPGLWDDPNSSWGHGSSPVIHRGLVIVQADGHKQSFIAAYDLKDGKQAWRVERGEITSWSTPTLVEARGRAELVANGGRFIRGYDPQTGRELWRFNDNDTEVKQQAPLFAHGLVYVTGGYPPGRGMYAFRPGASGDISLKEGEQSNAHLAWRSDKGSPYTTTPIVYGDLLYTVSDGGRAVGLRGADGQARLSGASAQLVQRLARRGRRQALPFERGRRCLRRPRGAEVRAAGDEPRGRAADGDARHHRRHAHPPRAQARLRRRGEEMMNAE